MYRSFTNTAVYRSAGDRTHYEHTSSALRTVRGSVCWKCVGSEERFEVCWHCVEVCWHCVRTELGCARSQHTAITPRDVVPEASVNFGYWECAGLYSRAVEASQRGAKCNLHGLVRAAISPKDHRGRAVGLALCW